MYVYIHMYCDDERNIHCSYLFPIQTFNELLKPYMNEAEMMAMVAKSKEFEQVKVSILWLGVSILWPGASKLWLGVGILCLRSQ